MIYALFLLAAALVTAEISHGGGAVCDFTITMQRVEYSGDGGHHPTTFDIAIQFNSTGYHDVFWEQTCTGGDDGVSSVYFNFNGDTFTTLYEYENYYGGWEDRLTPYTFLPFYRHMMIGAPTNAYRVDAEPTEYWSFFTFAVKGTYGTFSPVGNFAVTYQSADETYSAVYLITKIRRGACSENPVPFVPSAGVTVTPCDEEICIDNYPYNYIVFNRMINVSLATRDTSMPVILAYNELVVYTDATGRHDVSQEFCGDDGEDVEGCWYFKQTPGGTGPIMGVSFMTSSANAQSSRFRVTLDYATLPNNKGSVYLCWGSAGLVSDDYGPDNIDAASDYCFWHGTLQGYGSGLNTLQVEIPMTSPPANPCSTSTYFNEGKQGYTNEYVLFVRGTEHSSFVLRRVRVEIMSANFYTCTFGRRESDGPDGLPTGLSVHSEAYTNATQQYWKGTSMRASGTIASVLPTPPAGVMFH